MCLEVEEGNKVGVDARANQARRHPIHGAEEELVKVVKLVREGKLVKVGELVNVAATTLRGKQLQFPNWTQQFRGTAPINWFSSWS